MITYKVWVCVEQHDDETDKYEDIDLPFAASAVFEKESVACGFASILDKIAHAMNPEAFAEAEALQEGK